MKTMFVSLRFPAATAALMIFVTTGCGRDGVKVYKTDAPEPTPPPAPSAPAPMPPAMSTAGVPTLDRASQPPLKYTVPAGWQEKQPSDLRVASFQILENGKQADVSVIPMGGLAGGDTANVNRWRGQVGLATATEAEIQKSAEKVSVAGESANLFDLAGTAPGSGEAERILATVLHREGTAWFFKVTGDSELVKKNKSAFVEFLKSVQFGGLAAPSTMDLSKLPPSHPAIPGVETAPVAPSADSPDTPKWDVPKGWQNGPLTQFLVAKFIATGANNSVAEINVSMLEGQGGGLLSNVNRWRGQLGEATVDAAQIEKLPVVETSAGKATLVEITGKNPRNGQPGKMIGIVLPRNDQTWFYKLMGDASVVTEQKDAFIKFVKSAKYP